MKNRPLSKLKIALLLMLVCGTSFAQPGTESNPWKRLITRKVFIYDKGIPKSKVYSLFAVLIDEAMAGHITAYGNSGEGYFTTAVTQGQLKVLTNSRFDTQYVTNPRNNKQVKKVSERKFDPSKVFEYELLEEWTFDRYKGTTTMQILGIAPLRTILNDDSSFRATQPIFWVKYEDVAALLKKDDEVDPSHSLLSAIWNDNAVARGDKHAAGEAMWRASRSHIINFPVADDTLQHRDIHDVYDDLPLGEMLAHLVKDANIHLYPDSTFTNVLSWQQLQDAGVNATDTTYVVNPETKQQVIKVNPYRNQIPTWTRYKLLEQKTFDYNKGTGTIQITGIALMKDIGTLKTQDAIFWVRYADIQPILLKYEAYHPLYSFYHAIWESYPPMIEDAYMHIVE